jgi:hypothetical protein
MAHTRNSRYSSQPSEGALDDPAFWQNLEADRVVGALDDFQVPGAKDLHGGGRDRSLIAAIGEDPLDEREQTTHGFEHEQAAIAILDVRWMNHDLQGKTQRVDQDVSLLSFDFLPRVVAAGVDPRPPFSAPLTLWLSMIAAVGLASLPDCSRTATNSV